MFIKFDALVMRGCTAFAHGFQRWFGRTSFFLAMLAVMVWSFSVLLYFLLAIAGYEAPEVE
jgi:hypothetical protein